MTATHRAREIPLRTLAQVKADLATDYARSPSVALRMARLMVSAGRLTPEARAYAASYRGE